MLIKTIIDDIKANDSQGAIPLEKIYTYIIYFSLMIIVNYFVAIIESVINLEISRISLRVRTSIISLIMKKMLAFPIVNPNKFTEGKILNFVTTDANKFEFCGFYVNQLFKSSLLILLTTIAIGLLAGYVCFPVAAT